MLHTYLRRTMPLIVEKRIFSLLAIHLSSNFHLLSVSPDSQVSSGVLVPWIDSTYLADVCWFLSFVF